ncbi:hypothetical protein WJX84_003595 [Apatococcus fuscideae]|uniref:Uncharacterized protein n=1 Tax=Apatococcus fuscideae TaxID=2026836 RepID=A0AAW1SQV7_9CHLO
MRLPGSVGLKPSSAFQHGILNGTEARKKLWRCRQLGLQLARHYRRLRPAKLPEVMALCSKQVKEAFQKRCLPHAASNSGPLPAPSRAPHGSLRAGPPSSASLRPQELGKAHANWSDPGQAPALLLSAAPDQNAPHPAGFHMPLCQTAAGRQAKQRAQRISDVPAQDESGSGVWSDPAALDAGQMLRHRDKRGSRLLQNAALGLTRPGEEGPRQAPAEPLDSALALPSLGGNAGPWAPGPRLTNELEAEQAFGKMLKACSDTFATYMDYLRQRQG